MPAFALSFCAPFFVSAVVASALPAVPGAVAPLAVDPVEDAPPLPDDDILPALDDLADASAELSEDVDRWVLHDVLQDVGRGQSLDWQQQVTDRSLQPQRDVGYAGWEADITQARLAGLLRGMPEQHHQIDTSKLAFDIPLAEHPLVDMYIDYFTGRGRLMFERWLVRAARYAPLMQRILAQKQVPQDLVYVAMIESGFSAHAYSTAAAAGYWQFMRATGKLYGLQQDHWVDERRDFIKATEAAATYMSQLHRTLGDWHLAWASYNAGEGRIRRALAKSGESSFWGLIDHPRIVAKETVHYVPKVIAAALVAKDARRYGFNIAVQPPLTFDEVPVQGAVDLHVLARRTRLDVATLKELNPALLHDITPPGKTTRLRVPTGAQAQFVAALQQIPVNQRLTYLTHQVRPGDTLSGIAHRFGTDLPTLRAFNRLQGKVLRVGQQVIVPTAGGTRPLAVAAVSRPANRAASRPALRPVAQVPSQARTNRPRHLRMGPRRHVVSAGETLWGIAHRYNVGIDRIRGHRRTSHLAVGDVLEIR
jgi:membrane-bound lytic murein transglycosylase D